MLLAHCDYGYAGTTHKVQGQTSEIHIASLDRNKDAASLYVSATRARDLAPPSPDGSGHSTGPQDSSTTRSTTASRPTSTAGPTPSTLPASTYALHTRR